MDAVMQVLPPTGGFTSLEREVVIDDVPIVRGAIPAWLSGALYRNGPGRFDWNGETISHWFYGLAMVHRFGLRDGRVSYRNRLLDTPLLQAIRRTGGLAAAYAELIPKDASGKPLPGAQPLTANAGVSVANIGGTLIGLVDLQPSIAFDAHTLDTLGRFDFGHPGERWSATPHPSIDGATREYFNIGMMIGRDPEYRLYRVAPGAQEKEIVGRLPVRDLAYMHSFALTARHVVIVEMPYFFKSGGEMRNARALDLFRWMPERPTRFLVLERETGRLAATFEAERFFNFHQVNAFERDGDLVLDLVASEGNGFDALYLDVVRDPAAFRTHNRDQRPRRYVLPLSSRTSGPVDWALIADTKFELPTVNPTRSAHAYRFTYAMGAGGDGLGWFDQLVKGDTESGATRIWRRHGWYPGEALFVPHPEADEEDSGVVMTVAFDAASSTSSLILLDAQDLSEIAEARLPHHVPFGFHGQFFRA